MVVAGCCIGWLGYVYPDLSTLVHTMAIKAISELPDPIQALSDEDYMILSQFDGTNFVSVKVTLAQLKAYLQGDCVPSGLTIPEYAFPAGTYSFEYQVNGGAVQSYSSSFESVTDGNVLLYDLFSNADFSPIILVGDGGGMAHFQYGYYNHTIAAAEGNGNDAATITLLAIDGQENDPIQTLFNVDSVTMHACGTQYFPGI